MQELREANYGFAPTFMLKAKISIGVWEVVRAKTHPINHPLLEMHREGVIGGGDRIGQARGGPQSRSAPPKK